MGKAKPIQVSEVAQPTLFAPDQMPTAPVLVAAAKVFAHTGKVACKDEERAEAIIQHYLATGSLRATARQFHVSPHTVSAMVAVYSEAGKLDALKQRVSAKLGVVIELATDNLVEKLQDGTVPANVLPIVLGVAVEKKALLDGEATSRSESVRVEPVRLGDLAAYLRKHGVEAPAIDVQSTVEPQKP